MSKKVETMEPNDAEFKDLVDLLAIYSEASNQLEQMQATANEQQLEVVDGCKSEYAKLQQTLLDTTSALEIVARRHPTWFTTKKTIKTPYGEVKLADNPPSLDVPNEELSIVLIELEERQTAGFNPQPYIREERHLNLDALKTLDDETLAKFRIKRKQSDTFSVKPARMDLGKAVEKAAEAA